MVLSILHSSLL